MSILSDLLALKATKAEQVVEAHDSDYDAEDLEHMVDLFSEYHEKMTKIMYEVKDAIRMLPKHYRGPAEAYWIPHIFIALGGEHEWMTAGHESTMQKTIDEMREEAEAHRAHDAHLASGGDSDEDRDADEEHFKKHGNDPMGTHHGRNY